jgi:hypothetical protein
MLQHEQGARITRIGLFEHQRMSLKGKSFANKIYCILRANLTNIEANFIIKIAFNL